MCQRYLQEQAIDSYPDLLRALSLAFEIQPDDLHVCVHDMFTSTDREVQTVEENWLISYGITRKQYLCFVVNRRKPIDGLFLWLLVHTMRQHINVLHASGVWTSRCSDITVLTDASLVLILNCCLVMKCMTREEIQKRDDEYTEQLCDPYQCLQNYVHMPRILNDPVKNIEECMDEIGLCQMRPDAPIQEHLASLLEYDVTEFRHQLVRWIRQFELDVQIISSWLAIRGLTIEEYVAILEQGCDSDGLEVWIALVALGQPLNMIFELTVWSTAVNGFDHAYPSLLLTSHATAVLCIEEKVMDESDLSHLGAAAQPLSSMLRPATAWKGRPLTSVPEYPRVADSDHSDTDPEDMIQAKIRIRPPIVNAGCAIPHSCLVCKVEVELGMALYRHMCMTHPHDKPYSCCDCGTNHNNLKELSSHHSNVHRSHMVSCSQCNYSCISKAKMHQHIRHHTTGYLCQKCGKGFPTFTELLCHEHLHDARKVFDCEECGAEY